MQRLTLASCCMLVLTACTGDKKENVGTAAGNMAADTQVVKAAQAAVNDVIRAAPDCDAVKAALPAATRALDDADRAVKTETGRGTLRTLRKQMQTTADTCP